MTNIDEQVKDWEHLKVLTQRVTQSQKHERRRNTDELYSKINLYVLKYNIPFNFSQKPGEMAA